MYVWTSFFYVLTHWSSSRELVEQVSTPFIYVWTHKLFSPKYCVLCVNIYWPCVDASFEMIVFRDDSHSPYKSLLRAKTRYSLLLSQKPLLSLPNTLKPLNNQRSPTHHVFSHSNRFPSRSAAFHSKKMSSCRSKRVTLQTPIAESSRDKNGGASLRNKKGLRRFSFFTQVD